MSLAFIICGSTGAGKTTYSQKLAEERGAQVFSIDEWMKILFWMDAPTAGDLDWTLARVRRCEEQIWLVTKRLLDRGHSVVLDLGFSKKEQRDRFKLLLQNSKHRSELHFIDIPVEVRRSRVEKRNLEKSGTYEFEVDQATFDWMENYFERPSENELAGAIVIGL